MRIFFTPRKPRRFRLRRNSVQNGSASLAPTFMPSTWRWPSVWTLNAPLIEVPLVVVCWWQMAQLAAAPAYGYDHAYQLPTSPYCLRVLELYEEREDGDDWLIEGRSLITDADTALWARLNGVFWAAFLLFSWTTASIVSASIIERVKAKPFSSIEDMAWSVAWAISISVGIAIPSLRVRLRRVRA